VNQAAGPETGQPPPLPRWIWLPRIAAFVGIFLVSLFAVFQVLFLLGAPAPASTEAAQLLNGWNVFGMIVAAGIASVVAQVKLSRRRVVDLGLPGGRRGLTQLFVGVCLGVAILGAVVLAFVALGWLSWTADDTPGSAPASALSLAAVLLGAAFVEELLFRGYPFQVLERRFGALVALVATSLAFSAAHGLNPNAAFLPLINIGLAGVLLGVAYWRTRSLWFATGLHMGWNWVMAVSELSVSGLDFRMPGFDPVLGGPELMTGGDFGPEGGLLVTVASVAAIGWLWRWRPKDVSLSRR
jgi:membrane protease YdiL (CAAX protease family)